MPRSIPRLLTDTAERLSDKTAIVSTTRSVTFSQLHRESLATAECLRELGIQPGDRIGICMEKTVDQVSAILGVLFANAVVVPSAAIQVGQNGPYVFVIKPDSTVELRLVRIDRTVNDKTVIASGLAAGERVVVDGQLRLNNGTRVTVQRPEGGTPAKAQPTPVAER